MLASLATEGMPLFYAASAMSPRLCRARQRCYTCYLAKFKPAGAKKPKAEASKRGFIPCLVILGIGFLVIFLLIYAVMRSG